MTSAPPIGFSDSQLGPCQRHPSHFASGGPLLPCLIPPHSKWPAQISSFSSSLQPFLLWDPPSPPGPEPPSYPSLAQPFLDIGFWIPGVPFSKPQVQTPPPFNTLGDVLPLSGDPFSDSSLPLLGPGPPRSARTASLKDLACTLPGAHGLQDSDIKSIVAPLWDPRTPSSQIP